MFVSLLRGRRWGLLSLAVVAVSAVVSGAYVYWRVNAPSSALYVTATSPPLELRMELDKAEFRLNETIAIHLSLTNIGDRTITILTGSPDHWVGFIVKDENNTIVRIFPSGGVPTVDEATLEPGGQISRTYDWRQVGHYPDGHGGVVQRSVPRGTYHIIGRTVEHLAYSLEAEVHVYLETPAITTTIG